MSATPSNRADRMTVQQYLEWAGAQPKGRYELVNGVPFKMSPERNIHAFVKGAVYRTLLTAVAEAGLSYVVLPDGPTVVIDEYQSREPDIAVQASATIEWDAMTVDSPLIVVEVTSPSTMRIDTDDKLIEYFSLPSVHHYLLVHPDRRAVVHHRRVAGGSIETSIALGGSIRFEPPGFTVVIARFFEDLPPGKAH